MDSYASSEPPSINQSQSIPVVTNLFDDMSVPSISSASILGDKLLSYLRIRPTDEEVKDCYQVIDDTILRIKSQEANLIKRAFLNDKKSEFQFTQIFHSSDNQAKIFEKVAKPLIYKWLTGINALLFCYGTTSSGKSYTIRGTSEEPGLIPRTIKYIFDFLNESIDSLPTVKRDKFANYQVLNEKEIQEENRHKNLYFESSTVKDSSTNRSNSKLQYLIENTQNTIYYSANDSIEDSFGKDRKCGLWISFFEIYNDYAYDLLADPKIRKTSLKIKLDESENYYVAGLKHVFVTSFNEALSVFWHGLNNLDNHIQKTGLNETSSRSHCIFNITLIKYNSSFDNVTVSTFSLCDLAGLERGKKTLNTGERLREAGNIHKSLLALNQCMTFIKENQKNKKVKRVVPYHQSRLTKIFQPFLSGVGMATMIININPAFNLLDETLYALEFSATASDVQVSNEDCRKKLQESYRRLTQAWFQSTKRWSSFSKSQIPKPSVSTIINSQIQELDEDEDDDEFIDMEKTKARESLVQKQIEDMKDINFDNIDPLTFNKLMKQMDYLQEQLAICEKEKFDLDLKLRSEFGKEMHKALDEMYMQNQKSQDEMRSMYQEITEKRIEIYKNKFTTEKEKLILQKEELTHDLFKANEQIINLSEKLKEYEQRSSLEQETSQSRLEIISKELEEEKQKNKELSVLKDENLKFIKELEKEKMEKENLVKIEAEYIENKKELDSIKNENQRLLEIENFYNELKQVQEEKDQKILKLEEINKEIKIELDSQKENVTKLSELQNKYDQILSQLDKEKAINKELVEAKEKLNEDSNNFENNYKEILTQLEEERNKNNRLSEMEENYKETLEKLEKQKDGQISELENKCSEYSKELEKEKCKSKDLETLNEKNINLIEELEKKCNGYSKKMEEEELKTKELETLNKQKTDQIIELEKKCTEYSNELNEEKSKNKESEELYNQKDDRIIELEKKCNDYSKELEEEKLKNNEMKQIEKQKDDEIMVLQQKCIQYSKELDEEKWKNEKIEKLQSDNDEMVEKLKEIEIISIKLDELNNKYSDIVKELEEQRNKYEELTILYSGVTKELEEKTKINVELETQYHQSLKQFEALQQELNEVKQTNEQNVSSLLALEDTKPETSNNDNDSIDKKENIGRVDELENRIRELEKKCKEYEATIELNDKILAKREKELEKLKTNSEDILKPGISTGNQATVNIPTLIPSAVKTRRRTRAKSTNETPVKDINNEYLKRFAKTPNPKTQINPPIVEEEEKHLAMDDLIEGFETSQSKAIKKAKKEEPDEPIAKRKRMPLKNKPFDCVSPVVDDKVQSDFKKKLRSRKKVSYN